MDGRPRYPEQAAIGTAICPMAEEVPVAFSFGGIAHAVMMATPADLHDFAVGFSITEGIAATRGEIGDIAVRESGEGVEVDVRLAGAAFSRFLGRRRFRNLRGHTSCGLCGVEDLGGVAGVPLGRVLHSGAGRAGVAIAAVQAALRDLREYQPLSRATHAAHAAAWATADGGIVVAREDVGRHSALDKLIGACLRASVDFATGFCIVTSRCSFEMVQKAVVAGIPVLAAVSAPTALAVRSAQAAGLGLIARAAGHGMHVYSDAGRIRH